MMTIEATLIERKRDAVVGNAKKTITKKKCRRTKKIRVPAPVPARSSMTLQKLFFECKNAFKGPGTVPSPDDVDKLQHIIDEMKPEDFGLRTDLLFLKHRNPIITYTTVIYQCKNFSLCLFFLPTTAVIPLHNHPGMTVFSKLLLGSMHIKSYDWVDPDKSDDPALSSQSVRLATLKTDNVFTAPCNASVLYPTSGGNIHAFTAVTPCVVLDVIGPPYSGVEGRDCTYYKEITFSGFSDGSLDENQGGDSRNVWLEEIETPKDLNMQWTEYRGPEIIE